MIQHIKNKYISIWLLITAILVALMIIVGGLTRLTDSGLSITNWGLISGIIPPLTLNDWDEVFSLYKNIPEYKFQNFNMTLDQFKFIFWWEYAHRFLGRFLGIFYILPLFFFTIKKSIDKKILFSLYLIFFLILLQGFLGWYMVKSGLTDRIDVSHYRLSLHLTLAFIIYILLFWNYLKFQNNKKNYLYKISNIYLFFLLFVSIVQISVGALVSGLDAGQIYQTWPLMNESYFPDDTNIKDLSLTSLFENPSLIQFIHRNIAYFFFLLFLFLMFRIFINKNLYYLRKNALVIFLLLTLQILLGIFTIISGAQILVASMHQAGSIFLVTAILLLIYKNSN